MDCTVRTLPYTTDITRRLLNSHPLPIRFHDFMFLNNLFCQPLCVFSCPVWFPWSIYSDTDSPVLFFLNCDIMTSCRHSSACCRACPHTQSRSSTPCGGSGVGSIRSVRCPDASSSRAQAYHTWKRYVRLSVSDVIQHFPVGMFLVFCFCG